VPDNQGEETWMTRKWDHNLKSPLYYFFELNGSFKFPSEIGGKWLGFAATSQLQ
jgi:hypothetical protein